MLRFLPLNPIDFPELHLISLCLVHIESAEKLFKLNTQSFRESCILASRQVTLILFSCLGCCSDAFIYDMTRGFICPEAHFEPVLCAIFVAPVYTN